MTIEQPVVLDVGPEEFSIGLSYTGSSRTRDFVNLAFDPMPSFNRFLKIFSRPSFKEKEVEVKRRAKEIGRREMEVAVLGLSGEEMEVQEELDVQEEMEVQEQGEVFGAAGELEAAGQAGELSWETGDLEEDMMSSQLSQMSV